MVAFNTVIIINIIIIVILRVNIGDGGLLMWRTWELIFFDPSLGTTVLRSSHLVEAVFNIIIAIAMDQSFRRKPSRTTSQCMPTHPPPPHGARRFITVFLRSCPCISPHLYILCR
jgi:hypothetical protein